ncbi:MAG: hypothetical protein ACYDD0_09580 [Candidatus Dormibacteria bacterium]
MSADAHANGVAAPGLGREVPELAGPRRQAIWSSFYFAEAVGGGPIALLRQWSGRTALAATSGLAPPYSSPGTLADSLAALDDPAGNQSGSI